MGVKDLAAGETRKWAKQDSNTPANPQKYGDFSGGAAESAAAAAAAPPPPAPSRRSQRRTPRALARAAHAGRVVGRAARLAGWRITAANLADTGSTYFTLAAPHRPTLRVRVSDHASPTWTRANPRGLDVRQQPGDMLWAARTLRHLIHYGDNRR